MPIEARDSYVVGRELKRRGRKWEGADGPDQSGRVVFTGSNTGIGYRTAAVLA